MKANLSSPATTHVQFDPDRAFFYGQFVQAAYTMFRNHNADPLRPEPAGLPAGWELAAWIHMSDFFLNLEAPEFYGIVARETADPDSRVIAIRGTEGKREWFDDAVAYLSEFSQVPDAGKVAHGFDKIYSSLQVVKRTLPHERAAAAAAPAGTAAAPETFAGSFAEQLAQLATQREVARGVRLSAAAPRQARPTVVAGHSLGSALTSLFVLENASKHKFDIGTLCTFASPKVGNREFVERFNRLPVESWRIVNSCDEVPKLPLHLPFFGYEHVDTAFPFASNVFAKDDLSCCHAMETYLHWLNESSPLRAGCGKGQ